MLAVSGTARNGDGGPVPDKRVKWRFCWNALWSLMAQSVNSRRCSKRSLSGVKRTSADRVETTLDDNDDIQPTVSRMPELLIAARIKPFLNFLPRLEVRRKFLPNLYFRPRPRIAAIT